MLALALGSLRFASNPRLHVPANPAVPANRKFPVASRLKSFEFPLGIPLICLDCPLVWMNDEVVFDAVFLVELPLMIAIAMSRRL